MSYGELLFEVKKDYEEAERIFVRTLKKDPNDVGTLKRYAKLLEDMRKYSKKAEEMKIRAAAVLAKIESTYTNLRERSNYQVNENMKDESPTKRKRK